MRPPSRETSGSAARPCRAAARVAFFLATLCTGRSTRALVPASLFGRLLFVGLAGCVLLTVLSLFELRLQPDSAYRRTAISIEARFLATHLQPLFGATPSARAFLLPHLNREGVISLTLVPVPPSPTHGENDTAFADLLRRHLREVGVELNDLRASLHIEPVDDGEFGGQVEAAFQLDNTLWLKLVHRIERLPDSTRPLWRSLLLRLPLEGLLVLVLALTTVFWIVRPLQALVRATEAVGRDLDAPPLCEQTGPREIRETARAFNSMCERLRTTLRQRAFVFAAISHDLRTPLTRLGLRLESVNDDALRDKLLADAHEVRQRLDEAIRVVRAIQTDKPEEQAVRVDVMALVESVIDDRRDMGQEVTLEGAVNEVLLLPPTTFRQSLDNLIGNAVRYGGTALVRLERENGHLRLDVLDNGPGIPANELEKVFEPFYRLDASRSQQTGGHGLGLAIARASARQCGGDVELTNRPEGGLCASLRLPLALSASA